MSREGGREGGRDLKGGEEGGRARFHDLAEEEEEVVRRAMSLLATRAARREAAG